MNSVYIRSVEAYLKEMRVKLIHKESVEATLGRETDEAITYILARGATWKKYG